MNKKLEVVFAPGCFDNFEGTQKELDDLIAEIKNMAERGEIDKHARQLSKEEEEEILLLLSQKEKRQ